MAGEHPQGLKPRSFLDPYGTAEAVPRYEAFLECFRHSWALGSARLNPCPDTKPWHTLSGRGVCGLRTLPSTSTSRRSAVANHNADSSTALLIRGANHNARSE